MMDDQTLYSIALSIIPGIGSVTARKLICGFGDAAAVFRQKKEDLIKVQGVNPQIAEVIFKKESLVRAEKEVNYTRRHGIRILHFSDKNYPSKLNECPDGPVVLYVKGDAKLNHKRVLSIVGTRSPTSYGTGICRKLIDEISADKQCVIIVSGLAYGIDICAHKAALKNGLQTWTVLGHGLGFIYPGMHRPVAKKIQDSGALITDFIYSEKPERQNFIKRNRIIAGISDATIVIESGTRGGALLTAQMADSYNRDVMTFPGRTIDPMSAGCNHIIKDHKATMIESWEDVKYNLGWDDIPPGSVQGQLFRTWPEDETLILQFLEKEGESDIDAICRQTGMPVSKISSLLLNLEFAGEIVSLPGDVYKLTL